MGLTADRATGTAKVLAFPKRNREQWTCLKILPKLPPLTNPRRRYEK